MACTSISSSVAQRQEWDEEGFLRKYPEVKEALDERLYVDGLQYFVEKGFAGNFTGAWVPENHDVSPTILSNDEQEQKYIRFPLVRPYSSILIIKAKKWRKECSLLCLPSYFRVAL